MRTLEQLEKKSRKSGRELHVDGSELGPTNISGWDLIAQPELLHVLLISLLFVFFGCFHLDFGVIADFLLGD